MDTSSGSDAVHKSLSNDNRAVTIVRVVCQTGGELRVGFNHWFISLILSDGKSHKMDMRQYSTPPATAKLEWTLDDDNQGRTPSGDVYFDYRCASINTVQSVAALCELIHRKGRQHYSYASPAAGCRYWVYTIIKDLDESGWLRFQDGRPASDDLLPKINRLYRDGSPYTEDVMKGGTFGKVIGGADDSCCKQCWL